MHRMVKWMAPVVAMGLLVGVSATRAADDAAKTGSVSGTVMGVDGKPAENVPVRLMKPHVKADASATADKTAEKPSPVATATTDDKGKFEMKDVPAGDYNVNAGSKKSGGMAHNKVTVTAGSDAEVSLTLKAGDSTKGKKHKHAADTTDTK